MGIIGAAIGERSNLATPEKWLVEWFKGGAQTPAGVMVTEETALHYSPFFAGVRILSEDLAGLPFPLYRHLEPKGKERATDHPLYRLLHDAPNPIMSSQAFREALTGHAIMWGNGYAEIERRRGEIQALWPLRPDRMEVKYNREQRRLSYHYDEHTTGTKRIYLPDEILHIPGFGFDGVRGYSVLELARNSIGAGVAVENFGATFFGNAARSAGVLTHPGRLSETARNNLRDSWEAQHRGLENAHRVAILEEGLEWHQIGIPPEEAQFLETRRYDVLEQARWLRLPPHMLAELGRATWNNIESERIDYVTKSLRNWMQRWESAVWMRLLDRDEQPLYFAEHLVEGLLRGDTKSRFEAYRIGREIGLYSADDLAEMENRNPLPDGKGEGYYVPLNWVEATAPSNTPPAGTQAANSTEARAARAATSRRRIADAFMGLASDAEERIAKIERNQVGRLVRKYFTPDDEEPRSRNSVSSFVADVTQLYDGEIFDQSVDRWRPVIAALAAQIFAEAADEVAYEGDINLDNWVATFVATHASYRSRVAANRLTDLALDSAGPTDAAQRLTAQLDDWVANRAERIARKETIQMANAGAREVWRTAGVREMRWVISGGCPYCKTLDGKTVGIEQTFLTGGQDLEATNGDLMPIESNTYHPPAHNGCVCMIVAS